MVPQYVAPKFEAEAFNCPNCRVYCTQKWFKTYFLASNPIPHLTASLCTSCNSFSLWFKNEMIFPVSASGPLPADDMPAEAKQDYLTARTIVTGSPQAAAALLRRAYCKLVEVLMKQINRECGSLDDDLETLQNYGLPEQICNGLKLTRVIGNDLVPAGLLDERDDKQTAAILFQLLNITVEIMITQPQKISALYSNIPGIR